MNLSRPGKRVPGQEDLQPNEALDPTKSRRASGPPVVRTTAPKPKRGNPRTRPGGSFPKGQNSNRPKFALPPRPNGMPQVSANNPDEQRSSGHLTFFDYLVSKDNAKKADLQGGNLSSAPTSGASVSYPGSAAQQSGRNEVINAALTEDTAASNPPARLMPPPKKRRKMHPPTKNGSSSKQRMQGPSEQNQTGSSSNVSTFHSGTSDAREGAHSQSLPSRPSHVNRRMDGGGGLTKIPSSQNPSQDWMSLQRDGLKGAYPGLTIDVLYWNGFLNIHWSLPAVQDLRRPPSQLNQPFTLLPPNAHPSVPKSPLPQVEPQPVSPKFPNLLIPPHSNSQPASASPSSHPIASSSSRAAPPALPDPSPPNPQFRPPTAVPSSLPIVSSSSSASPSHISSQPLPPSKSEQLPSISHSEAQLSRTSSSPSKSSEGYLSRRLPLPRGLGNSRGSEKATTSVTSIATLSPGPFSLPQPVPQSSPHKRNLDSSGDTQKVPPASRTVESELVSQLPLKPTTPPAHNKRHTTAHTARNAARTPHVGESYPGTLEQSLEAAIMKAGSLNSSSPGGRCTPKPPRSNSIASSKGPTKAAPDPDTEVTRGTAGTNSMPPSQSAAGAPSPRNPAAARLSTKGYPQPASSPPENLKEPQLASPLPEPPVPQSASEVLLSRIPHTPPQRAPAANSTTSVRIPGDIMGVIQSKLSPSEGVKPALETYASSSHHQNRRNTPPPPSIARPTKRRKTGEDTSVTGNTGTDEEVRRRNVAASGSIADISQSSNQVRVKQESPPPTIPSELPTRPSPSSSVTQTLPRPVFVSQSQSIPIAPSVPQIKRERSSSPAPALLSPSPPPLKKAANRGSLRIYPLPANCQKTHPRYAENRKAWVMEERKKVIQKVGKRGIERCFLREDGLVIDWKSAVPLLPDTLLPPEDDMPEQRSTRMQSRSTLAKRTDRSIGSAPAAAQNETLSRTSPATSSLSISSQSGSIQPQPTKTPRVLPHSRSPDSDPSPMSNRSSVLSTVEDQTSIGKGRTSHIDSTIRRAASAVVPMQIPPSEDVQISPGSQSQATPLISAITTDAADDRLPPIDKAADILDVKLSPRPNITSMGVREPLELEERDSAHNALASYAIGPDATENSRQVQLADHEDDNGVGSDWYADPDTADSGLGEDVVGDDPTQKEGKVSRMHLAATQEISRQLSSDPKVDALKAAASQFLQRYIGIFDSDRSKLVDAYTSGVMFSIEIQPSLSPPRRPSVALSSLRSDVGSGRIGLVSRLQQLPVVLNFSASTLRPCFETSEWRTDGEDKKAENDNKGAGAVCNVSIAVKHSEEEYSYDVYCRHTFLLQRRRGAGSRQWPMVATGHTISVLVSAAGA
ncbi:hypothetical protein K474DRAFT_358635 [Panus rudis PR-1116 ss-1]|nr:hypothetical protein K474DRAFT_358635 [Panus rudis PR-1116 ss-1]